MPITLLHSFVINDAEKIDYAFGMNNKLATLIIRVE